MKVSDLTKSKLAELKNDIISQLANVDITKLSRLMKSVSISTVGEYADYIIDQYYDEVETLAYLDIKASTEEAFDETEDLKEPQIRDVINVLEAKQKECQEIMEEAKADGCTITAAQKKAEIYAYNVAILKLEAILL